MRTSSVSACPVCESKNVLFFLEHEYLIPFTPDVQLQYAECQVCGFVFCSTPLQGAQRQRYYDSPHRWAQIYNRIPPAADCVWEEQYRFITDNAPQACSFLEIGSGPGYLLRMLRDRIDTCRAEGYEVCERACEYGRKCFGLTMHHSSEWSLEELAHSDRYQAVLLRHVLEHIVEPLRFIRQAIGLLEEDGRLFVEVWAWDELDGKAQTFPMFEHVNYFCASQLECLLRRAGAEIAIFETKVLPANWEKPFRVLRCMARKAPVQDAIPAGATPSRAEAFLRHRELRDSLRPAARVLEERLHAEAGWGLKYALFSASNETTALLRRTGMARQVDLIAVFDNNRAKWGLELEGVPVRSPEDIPRVAPDRIVIGSSAFQEDIRQELLGRGVSESAIVTLWPVPSGEDE